MFSLFKNDAPPYSVRRIQKGELLDKATLAGVDTFFSSWLNKRPRKAAVGCWFILHQDDDFVYWGKPVFKGLFSDDRTVDEFFKTSRMALSQQFPFYQKQYHYFLWERLYAIIKNEVDGISALRKDKALSGFIEEQQFHIKVSCCLIYPKQDGATTEVKAQYKIVLNHTTLDLLSIERLV